MENKEARIDKWLWAARIFKTRTIAAAACKKGQVSIQGAVLKPSRMVKVGDVINVRKPPITYSFRILKAIERRIGAKLIPEVLENVTSPDQFELVLPLAKETVAQDVPQKKSEEIWKNSPMKHLSFSEILISMMMTIIQQARINLACPVFLSIAVLSTYKY